MSAVLADTVTIVRWLADDPRLSETAVTLLQAADDGYGIHISAITLVDIWYATHKRHHPIEFDELNSLDDVVAAPEINIHVLPVSSKIAQLAREPSREELPDPFDRVILATARAHDLPLVSPDRSLRGFSPHPARW